MIQQFADWLIYSLLGLSANTPLGSSYNPQNEMFGRLKTKSCLFKTKRIV